MLQVKHLNKKIYEKNSPYDHPRVVFQLSDISFHLPMGYICGLIGENGAGKTTLLNALTGLTKSEGTIVVDGMNMQTSEGRIKDELGVILDKPLYNKNMTLEQIGLLYGELYHHFHMEQYLQYLQTFQLDKKKRFKVLSKGMEIKVQLAFALSHEAKLFILDEPTAGLDKTFREKFLDICMELVADGTRSILISSHITEDLDRIADYIGYIQKGELLLFDSKETLCDRFRIVEGENYKIKQIPKEEIVYMETDKYVTSAMVTGYRWKKIEGLELHRPTIREFMYYLVKGGENNAKDFAQ